MLIEQIIQFQLRDTGPPGRICRVAETRGGYIPPNNLTASPQ